MKVVIDISSSLYERAQQALEDHKYSSLGQLASVALENQLLLEAAGTFSPPDVAGTPETHARSAGIVDARNGFSELGIPQDATVPTLDAAEVARSDVANNGWLWGIVNRILPIKIAARSLLLDSEGPLPQAAALAAQRAEAAAKWLSRAYGEVLPPREDSLLTGLPMREPLYKARQRFADSFFGRVDKSGNSWGALFELGLAGTQSRGRVAHAALTREGVAFAALPSPVLDAGDLTSALSAAEIDAYLDQVVMRIPRERHCFQVLLSAVDARDRTVDDLSDVAARQLPRSLSPAAVQTMKAGALGRLQDLRFVLRTKAGRSARFAITESGEAALAKLRGPEAGDHRAGASE